MFRLLAFRVTFSIFFCTISISCSEIRKTEYGLIQGEKVRSAYDPSYEFYSFKSVPYARPPVGNLRFQEPVAPEPWTDIRKTVEPALKCAQISNNTKGDDLEGSEDCLYLEIFEPITARKNNTNLLPVMVWFHGGTFVFGSPNASGPDYLMEKQVLMVTVQFRLNVFGFLSTLDQNAKGNAGLKDQTFALQWIKNNIEQFGGDPNKVTLFGVSAGGTTVLYHMLSKKSHGLFHRAISQSGTTINRWGYQKNPLEKVARLAKGLGINATDSKTLVEKLQKVDARTLVLAASNKSIVGWFLPYDAQPFGPVTESESDTAFITENTFKMLETNNYARVPYMVGYNTEEGSFAYDCVVDGRVDIKIYEEHPELLIPSGMNVAPNSSCVKTTIEDIKNFYFKNGNITDPYNWIPFLSQDIFARGIIKTVDLTYQQMPLYFYLFSYTGSRKNSHIGGVGHLEEIEYLLYPRKQGENPNETENDRLTRKRMVTMWTNFATTGNPTPVQDELLQNFTWPRMDSNKRYLNFGLNLTLAENPNQPDSKFWEDLYDRCGNPPYFVY